MGGLIVMFAAIGVIPLVMWSNARGRLATARSLIQNQPWPVVKAYTAGNRGYVAMRIADRLVTLSFGGTERSTPPLIVRVDLPAPGLPHFDIMPRSLLGVRAGDLFAGDTIEVGEPALDAACRVRSREPAAARGLWTRELCNRFRVELPQAAVRGDAEAVVLGVDVIPTEDLAVRAVKLALDIALAGVYGLDALRALPGATPRIDDAGVCVEIDGPSPIFFRPVREGTRVFTMATVDEGVAPPALPDTTALGDNVTFVPAGRGVLIMWPGIETERAHLVAAIDMLRNVGGAPHDGAYR